VDGLANLRNRLGDAHGQGKRPVKPLPRHAELAVNMAGSIASFLLATFEARSIRERRLRLTSGSTVLVPPNAEHTAHFVAITNTEGRFENTCHILKADLKFSNPHDGNAFKVQGCFVRTDGRSITGKPCLSVSLGMIESAHLVLLIRIDGADEGFCTFTSWPFDPKAERKLAFGEWQLHIEVSSDADGGKTTAKWIIQLNPNLSSSWSFVGP
jgi:hypothetical protein